LAVRVGRAARFSALALGALFGSGRGFVGGALFGFFQAIAVTFDIDDLGAVQESVDECDSAGRVGENFGPLGEGLVGAEDD
jgi:hypothetical protein